MAEDYFDKSNQHEVYLHRFATHLVNQYTTPNLQAAYKSARRARLNLDLTHTRNQAQRSTHGQIPTEPNRLQVPCNKKRM